MKSFVSTFFIILIICGIFTFFFASLIFSNIWYATMLIALIISIVVTVFAGQESRIVKLEEKLDEFLSGETKSDI
jgi:Flp pilus assembly protein TadB